MVCGSVTGPTAAMPAWDSGQPTAGSRASFPQFSQPHSMVSEPGGTRPPSRIFQVRLRAIVTPLDGGERIPAFPPLQPPHHDGGSEEGGQPRWTALPHIIGNAKRILYPNGHKISELPVVSVVA